MTVREQLAAGSAAAIALYGQTFEWKGRCLPCVRRDEPTRREVVEGGATEDIHYWLVVAKANFPDGIFPQDGDPVNRSAQQIKQVNGHKDPAAVQLILSIGSFDA